MIQSAKQANKVFLLLLAIGLGLAGLDQLGLIQAQTTTVTSTRSILIVDTVADLANLTPIDGTIVQTRGYNTAGDGGGNTYRYSKSSSTTVDGGFYLNGPNSIGRYVAENQDVVSVQQFGATAGNELDNDIVALQNAFSAASGGGTVLFNGGSYLVSIGYGTSIVVDSNTTIVFSNDSKIKVEYANSDDWAPLFYINGKSGITFKNPVIEWNADYVDIDGDNNKYELGLADDYFHSIWFIYDSSDILIDNPKTFGTDDAKCYNHGIFLRRTQNITVRDVWASHYGSWLFGWNSEDNAEFTISNGRFSKQTLKTNLHYGPGHPIYSFSGKSTITNITDDGTTVSYSETIQSADSGADTIQLSTGNFIVNNEVLIETTTGGLTAGTLYYVVDVDGQTIQLSETKGGSAVDITSDISSVDLSLSETMAGHTIKLRHNGSGTTDQIIVSGVTSKSPSGVLDIVDNVQNSSFSDISWHSIGDGRNYSDTFVGAFLLQGTTTSTGPTSCTFKNVILESGSSDICFLFMRSFFCSIDARIICASDSGFDRPAFYMSYANNNDVDITYTEQDTTAANQREMIRLDRRCRSNKIHWTLNQDIDNARTYGGKIVITGTTTSNFTAYPRDNRVVIERCPYFTPSQFEYIYYENSESMSADHKQLVFWLNSWTNEHGNYAIYDASAITGTDWSYSIDAPVLGNPNPTNYIMSWTTFDTGDNYAVNQLMSGTWVGLTGTTRSCHNVQPISTAVTRGDALVFTTGDGEQPTTGQKMVGQTSGVTAYVTSLSNVTGDWGAGSAAGDLRFESCRGQFQNGETISIDDGASSVVVSSVTTYSATPSEIWATQDGTITLTGTRSQNISQGALIIFSPLGVSRQ